MARDLHITLDVDTSKFQDALRTVSEKLASPDYGRDKHHNARLIGAYHAHFGMGGDPLVFSWRETLSLRDQAYINAYVGLSEWGRTDLKIATFPDTINRAFYDIGSGLASGIAMQKAAENVAATFQSMGASVTSDIALGIVSGIQSNDYVILERIKLRHWLERLYVPSVPACWIAGNWPVWALPLMLYSWLVWQKAKLSDWINRNG